MTAPWEVEVPEVLWGQFIGWLAAYAQGANKDAALTEIGADGAVTICRKPTNPKGAPR